VRREVTDGNKILKALCNLVAEISEREKKKAVQNDEYVDAAVLTVVREVFKEAGRPIK